MLVTVGRRPNTRLQRAPAAPLSRQPLGSGMIKPNRKVRFWCWTEVIGSAVLAWSGSALAYLAHRDGSPASVALLTPVLIVAIGFSFLAWWKCFRAVLVDSTLTEAERKRIRSWLCNFGPADVIQLLLFIHFPGSRLAGH